MRKGLYGLLAAVLLLVFAGLAAAQSSRSFTGDRDRDDRTLVQRQENQQRRLFEAVRRGDMSFNDFFRLEKMEGSIEWQRRNALRDGRLDQGEFQSLMGQFDDVSHRIEASARHDREFGYGHEWE